MALTPEQVQIVKATVPVLREYGNEITIRFYEDMLQEIPSLNNVFNQTNQFNGHQAAALAGSLYAYAAHIDDLGMLTLSIERISQKHASLYVQPSQYDIVGKYLLQAMGEVLAESFTPEIKNAWAVAYQQLADLMIKREAQLYRETNGWTGWRDFRICQKVHESPEIISFYLTPTDNIPLPSYLPGQYISLRISVPDINRLQARQYSLSDAPHPEYYRITVKKESAFKDGGLNAKTHSGYISNILHSETDVGDTIQVSHPAGDFFLDIREREFSDAPVVLISVGIGLTPNISILNTMIAKQSNREISWIHGARDSRAQAFAEHIKEIVSTHSNVQSHVFLKNPARVDREGTDYQFKGRVNLNMLEKDHDLFIHDGRAQYYTCGPVDFLSDIEVALSDFGVDRARIKLEVFDTGEVPRSARVLRA